MCYRAVWSKRGIEIEDCTISHNDTWEWDAHIASMVEFASRTLTARYGAFLNAAMLPVMNDKSRDADGTEAIPKRDGSRTVKPGEAQRETDSQGSSWG